MLKMSEVPDDNIYSRNGVIIHFLSVEAKKLSVLYQIMLLMIHFILYGAEKVCSSLFYRYHNAVTTTRCRKLYHLSSPRIHAR